MNLSSLLIFGSFTVVALLITIPLTFLLSTRDTLPQSAAAESTPTPSYFSPGQGVIAGYVYEDTDKDGEREAEEKPLKGITVHIKQMQKKESKQTSLKTDSHGYFRTRYSLHPSQPVSFSVSVLLPDKYATTDVNPVIISDLRPGRDRIIEFGIYSTQPTPSISIKPSATPKVKRRVTPTEIPVTPQAN